MKKFSDYLTEAVEQLNELSKDTLRSYVDKAKKRMVDKDRIGYLKTSSVDPGFSDPEADVRDAKYISKSFPKHHKIHKLVKRMKKRNFDDLDDYDEDSEEDHYRDVAKAAKMGQKRNAMRSKYINKANDKLKPKKKK